MPLWHTLTVSDAVAVTTPQIFHSQNPPGSPAALGVHRAGAAHPLPGHLPLALVSRAHPADPAALFRHSYCFAAAAPFSSPVQHWALGRYKQAATVMDKKITVSVRVDYSFFSPDRKEMSLHTSLGLLRAAPTSIRHCWSPSTPQPEMHLVGNASTWAEPFKGDQS